MKSEKRCLVLSTDSLAEMIWMLTAYRMVVLLDLKGLNNDLSFKGKSLWSKGSSEGWYFRSKSSGLTWRKWWGRSLLAHIGLELILYLALYYIIKAGRLALEDEDK